MHNKKNVIVMFLLIMLSFAIISEVSAVSDAEADGTGFNLSIKSVDMANHDIASERFDDGDMQGHDDYQDDYKSHNEQNSFDQSPRDFGDRNSNENLYEHNGIERPNGNDPKGFDESNGTMPQGNRLSDNFTNFDLFKLDGNDSGFGMMKPDGDRPLDNGSNFDMFKPDGKESMDNRTMDLRNNEPFNVPRGELMDDVISKFIGMNNISNNFKKDEKIPLNNNDKPKDNGNASAPQVPGDKKSSDMWSDGINKKDNDSKVVKKSNKNVKKVNKKVKSNKVKKVSKKVKSNKVKKVTKKLPKNAKKERVKR